MGKSTRKKVLMACVFHWTCPKQIGGHHLARGFAKLGWDIAYISNPICPLHLLGNMRLDLFLGERFAIYRTGGQDYLDGRLWTYVPGALLVPYNRPLLRSYRVHQDWPKLTWPNVVKKVIQNGFGEVDLLYIDSLTQSQLWLDAITYKKSVFRVSDYNFAFETFAPVTQQLEHELARSVDMVLYTAKDLEEHVSRMGPREMLHVANGVDFEHFSKGSRAMPLEYKNIPKPIAVYVGAMEEWFDYELLNQAAQSLPHISFVMIGPDKIARRKLKRLHNIYILGPRAHAEIPPYLYNGDVGIIPFDVEGCPNLVRGVNPLKLYEYMACGLPVVSVEWQELKNIESPAVLCKTKEQFIGEIDLAVSQAHAEDVWVDFAKRNDWSVRLASILNSIGMA